MPARRAEVVKAASAEFVVDSAGKACRYTTWSGRRLDDGYYFALWPRRCNSNCFDSRVRYFGPCATEAEARFLALSAHALGLLDPLPSRRRAAPRPQPTTLAAFSVA